MPFDIMATAGNFLNSVAGPLATVANNSISQALFGRTDRISNRDYQFYQDLADSGNPREIRRQNEFLTGVTPTNAAAYNTYQDTTQPQDTARQVDRIKTMSSELGMSPWEITGTGGANPLPSSPLGPQQGRGDASQFLGQLAPLQIAKMNNATQLQATKMNNETALKQTALQTGNGEQALAGIENTRQQTKNLISARELTVAQEALAQTQTAAAENNMYLDVIAKLAPLMGKTSVDIGGVLKSEQQNQLPELMRLYEALSNTQGTSEISDKIGGYIKDMNPDQFSRLKGDVSRAAKMVFQLGEETGSAIGSGVSKFLGNVGDATGKLFFPGTGGKNLTVTSQPGFGGPYKPRR